MHKKLLILCPGLSYLQPFQKWVFLSCYRGKSWHSMTLLQPGLELMASYLTLSTSTTEREGLPFSPFLYILAMEHLETTISSKPYIQGLLTGQRHFKLGFYADDLYSIYPTPGLHSWPWSNNFKCLGIIITQSVVSKLHHSFPFAWQCTLIKYLSVQISSNLDYLYDPNYKLLVPVVYKKLKELSILKHSWFGKMSSLKKDILPCILYVFQMVIIDLHQSFFCTL